MFIQTTVSNNLFPGCSIRRRRSSLDLYVDGLFRESTCTGIIGCLGHKNTVLA